MNYYWGIKPDCAGTPAEQLAWDYQEVTKQLNDAQRQTAEQREIADALLAALEMWQAAHRYAARHGTGHLGSYAKRAGAYKAAQDAITKAYANA